MLSGCQKQLCASQAYPAAHAIRPQLGSCPKIAAFVREDAAIDLAILAAALSSGAPVAVTSSRQVAPSPSHAIDFARPYSNKKGVLGSTDMQIHLLLSTDAKDSSHELNESNACALKCICSGAFGIRYTQCMYELGQR